MLNSVSFSRNIGGASLNRVSYSYLEGCGIHTKETRIHLVSTPNTMGDISFNFL